MNSVQERTIDLVPPATTPRRLHVQFTLTWQRAALGGILALAAFLNGYALDQNGYSNEFYAAAVKSMLASWHNFFFAAFDPGGFITVDKPPAALWIQTASAWLFGYNPVSILLPSVLAGLISVALVYTMVQRAFGQIAGLFAALALAVTPIAVIMDRHNNPESLLILVLVVAAWAMNRATNKGRIGWLLLAMVMVGIGFNMKMLEAFIVLPAFYLTYLLLAPIKWWKRFIHLALATVVLAIVSFSWAIAVDLTPADQRPYIGGSTDNTVLNLMLDYNGLNRVDGGQFGGNGGGFPGGQRPTNAGGQNRQPTFGQPPAPGGQPGNQNANNQGGRGGFGGGGFPGGGGGGGVVAGQAGPWRMFDPHVAGEAGWLLPLALLSLIVVAVQCWQRFPRGPQRTQRQQMLLLWGGWLLTFMVVFSMAKGTFHGYYLVLLAPAIAALAGMGGEALWHAYRRGSWQSGLLSLGLLLTAGFQFTLLSGYADWNRPLAIAVVALELFAACALLAVPLLFHPATETWAVWIAIAAFGGLLVAPAAWSVNAILTKTYTNATLPTAMPVTGGNANDTAWKILQANWNSGLSALLVGVVVLVALDVAVHLFRRHIQGHRAFDKALTVATVAVVISLGLLLSVTSLPPTAAAASRATNTTAPSTGIIGNPTMEISDFTKLIAFLNANRDGYTCMLATPTSENASAIIIKTGQPVMALGGFMGSDQVVTTQQLAAMVKNKTVRYVLLDNTNMGGGRNSPQQPTSWVQQTCKVVDSSLWSPTAASTTTRGTPQAGTSAARGRTGFGGGSQTQLYDCAMQS